MCAALLVFAFAFVVCACLLAVGERRWAPTRFVGGWFRGFCGRQCVREAVGRGGVSVRVLVGFGGFWLST